MSGSAEVQAAGLEGGEDLEARAAALRAQLAAQQAPVEELAQIEQQIQARDAAKLQAEAERLVLGLTRALHSFASSAQQDDLRLVQQAQSYWQAMVTKNERFTRYGVYKLALAALVEAAGLAMPEVPAVTVP